MLIFKNKIPEGNIEVPPLFYFLSIHISPPLRKVHFYIVHSAWKNVDPYEFIISQIHFQIRGNA